MVTSDKRDKRLRRKMRIRKKISGTETHPRISVFKSNKNIYAQLIDDNQSITIVAAGSTEKDFPKLSGNNLAKAVGEKLGERAIAKGIKEARFDRNGYLYHGNIKALADGARSKGLNF